MSSAVKDAQDHDVVVDYSEEDCVWESPQDRTSDLAMEARIRQWAFLNAIEDTLDRTHEDIPETGLVRFVPLTCFEEFLLSLRSEEESTVHVSPIIFRRTSFHGIAEPGSARRAGRQAGTAHDGHALIRR